MKEEAIYMCEKLPEIEIPSQVISIQEKVIFDCPSLESITVASDNPNYDSRNGCNAIIDSKTNALIAGCKGTVIPGSVTRIGVGAFMGSGIEEIVIPESVTEIGESAFEGCKELTSIILPSSIKRLPKRIFQGCTNLSSISIPKGVEYIDEGAFADCKSLTELTIPESVRSIANDIIFNCNGLRSITVSKKNKWFDSRKNCNAIVESATNKLILGIASSTIPSGIKEIGDFAFSTSLINRVAIPGSVVSIGADAFAYCRSLNEITVDKSNSKYDSRNNCNAIIESSTGTLTTGCTNTKLPLDITSIGNGAFKGCLISGYIKIPNNVKRIGDYAFLDCGLIESLVLPDILDSVGDFAIVRCSNLKYLQIGRIDSWGEGCFMRNYKLEEIRFSDVNRYIGNAAFYCSRELKSVLFPEGLETISRGAFENCTNLMAARLPQSLKTIEFSAFGNCKSLDTPIFPDNLKYLSLDAYYKCDNITELDVPESVQTIDGDGRMMKNLHTLKLPNKDALRDIRMTYSHNLKKIIIK